MKIAELTQGKKRKKVIVRIPAPLREKLGTQQEGIVKRIVPEGSVTWVEVSVKRKIYRFRPQDLTLA